MGINYTNIVWRRNSTGEIVQVIALLNECVRYINLSTSICGEIEVDKFCSEFTAIGENNS